MRGALIQGSVHRHSPLKLTPAISWVVFCIGGGGGGGVYPIDSHFEISDVYIYIKPCK